MDKLTPYPPVSTFQPQKDWPVLVVDDDSETLTISRIALNDYHFRGRGLEILEASSAKEALAILSERRDIAVILLDVVMETEHAGLALIETLRNQLGNHQIRIVLRTGESHFNLRQLIHQFDINDFHHKTEITAERLEIIITAALRGWSEIEVSATAATLREKARIAEAEMQILTKVQERLDDDLARAQRMQKGILPKPADLLALERSHGIACAAYFEPAHELAGDYWAIRSIDDQSITVILVDFSGHGVTAALNSFLFHSLWLRCPVELENPAASLSHLNRDLHELLPEGILATGMILTIHPGRRRIWWSASGWPCAALDHQGEVSWLSGEGPLLGPMESPEFLNYSREFQPEDSLILYSDALIETQDSLTGELPESIFRTRFQESLRAAKTKPTAEQLPCLIDSCLKNEDRPLRDDLTMVWLRAGLPHGQPEKSR